VGKDGEQYIEVCPLWVKLEGRDPQNPKKTVDHWGCAIAWMPILQIENTKETMEIAAASNSFRNEMVSRIDRARLNARGQDARATLIEAEEVPDGKEE
jgi:hypothetical protein